MGVEQNSTPWSTLTVQYPQAFPLDARLIRPLKIGIHMDIRAAHPEIDPRALRIALAKWCSRPVYQWTLAQGGARVDLYGQPAGEVTPEQQAHARERLQTLAEKRNKLAVKRNRPAQSPETVAEPRSAPTHTQETPFDPVKLRVPSRPTLSLKRSCASG
jgi:ProP effector